MKHTAILYCSTLAVMVALDLIWLGGIARDFYKSRMGELMEIQYLPALVFYLIYAAGILIFTHHAAPSHWHSTLLYGALFGFFAYATYDLTNLATLRGWSLSLSLADMAWGTFVTGAAAVAGRFITQWLLPAS